MIQEITLSITTTGSAGSATGSAKTPPNLTFNGMFLGAYVKWHASAPNTSDLTIAFDSHQVQLTKADSATSTFLPFRIQAVDTTGGAITGSAVEIPVDCGEITVSVAQCDALAPALEITLYFKDEHELGA